MNLINFNILKNPLNWLTVVLMLVIFALGADIVLRHYSDLSTAINPNPAAGQ